jgi:aryl-alcohol dehydrogenase-like predicted oxidoreductase
MSATALTPDLPVHPILNGMWQVSGAHGRIDREAALASMRDFVDAGFTTWDLADHYGPAEDFVGEFRRRLAGERGATALAGLQFLTKWVPRPGPMPRTVVERAVTVSSERMGMPALDLLQFHWWQYGDRRYLDALRHLADLRGEGRIRHLGLTNFDSAHVREIADAGIPVVSNQVQLSLVDRRPEVAMAPLCRERGIGLLAYGTLCGGLLSDRYLGQPEPGPASLGTASLRKYKQMIDAWGGWELFQALLAACRSIADRHDASIAAVALRWVLDRPAVAGAIVGVRLGVAEHRGDSARALQLALDAEDARRLDTVLRRGRDLFRIIGDCGDEYR